MQIGIVVPTYNEVENLSKLIPALFALPLDISVLVVDDNSPDGTGHLADELAQSNPKLTVLHRSQKLGLASAYIQGFRYFLESNTHAIGQMDADWSHDPATVVTMAEHLENCDVVFGSRYIKNGGVDTQWAFWRKGLSAWGNLYARAILRVPMRDVTTGFRLWRSETLHGIPLENVLSKGYIFQVETAYLAHCLEYRITETPIYFADRSNGQSKMSLSIQVEAALRTWQIWLTHHRLCHVGKAARIQGKFQGKPLL